MGSTIDEAGGARQVRPISGDDTQKAKTDLLFRSATTGTGWQKNRIDKPMLAFTVDKSWATPEGSRLLNNSELMARIAPDKTYDCLLVRDPSSGAITAVYGKSIGDHVKAGAEFNAEGAKGTVDYVFNAPRRSASASFSDGLQRLKSLPGEFILSANGFGEKPLTEEQMVERSSYLKPFSFLRESTDQATLAERPSAAKNRPESR